MKQYPPHEIAEDKENVLPYMSNFQKIDGKKLNELKKMIKREIKFMKI